MDKTQLKRHDLVYPSSIGRARLKQVFLNELTGAMMPDGFAVF